MVRGIQRTAIFRDDADRADFVGCLAALAGRGALTVYARALRSTHAHLLVRMGPRPLARSMRSLLTGDAGGFNRGRSPPARCWPPSGLRSSAGGRAPSGRHRGPSPWRPSAGRSPRPGGRPSSPGGIAEEIRQIMLRSPYWSIRPYRSTLAPVGFTIAGKPGVVSG